MMNDMPPNDQFGPPVGSDGMHGPQALQLPDVIEVEQALLGCIMVNNDALGVVDAILRPEHFSEPLHQRIYEACLQSSEAGRSVTPITIMNLFPRDLMVGEMTLSQYMARLAVEAGAPVAAKDFASAIIETAVARSAISEMNFAIETILQSQAPGVVTEAMERVMDVFAERKASIDLGMVKDTSPSWLDRMDPSSHAAAAYGVPIEFEELRAVLSEPVLEAGNLYGLLSSSGEGKTSFVLQMIYHALASGHPVAFLSFDQSRDQIFSQMAAQRLSIEVRRQKERRVSHDEFSDCEKFDRDLRAMAFDVVKCTNQKAGQLCTLARKSLKRFQKTNDKPALVVVDHIGAITSENDRVDPGTQAAAKNRILKSFAVETGSAVVVLNQRNSDGMKRTNPRPVAGDLYGGDRARNDYDAVFWLYRHRKWFDEKVAVAASVNDHKLIARVFPTVHFDEDSGKAQITGDIADIGALKVRFGDPSIRKSMNFVARFTRYEPMTSGQGDLYR